MVFEYQADYEIETGDEDEPLHAGERKLFGQPTLWGRLLEYIFPPIPACEGQDEEHPL